MCRFFVIILLALLPFQFTWAAVASYCGHESDAQAQHFGHHEHQHHGDSTVDQDNGDVAGKTLGSSDLDCGHCHGTCSALPAPGDGLMPLAIASHPATLDEGIVRAVWMTADEIRACPERHRSPLVLECLETYLSGARYPLSILTIHDSVFAPPAAVRSA